MKIDPKNISSVNKEDPSESTFDRKPVKGEDSSGTPYVKEGDGYILMSVNLQ